MCTGFWQAEMQGIRQLPFLAVMGLIKKPHAARLQAPSTDLGALSMAGLSSQDTQREDFIFL